MKGRNGFVSEHVVNLSDRIFSMAEINVLSKGLNFCRLGKLIDLN